MASSYNLVGHVLVQNYAYTVVLLILQCVMCFHNQILHNLYSSFTLLMQTPVYLMTYFTLYLISYKVRKWTIF